MKNRVIRRSVAHFSLKEEKLLSLVPLKPRRITSAELVAAYYHDEPETPLNAQKIVVGRMDLIGRKLEHNGDARRLCKTKRAGPHPIEFWLECVA